MFRVGESVVCIDNSKFLKYGKKYTIIEINESYSHPYIINDEFVDIWCKGQTFISLKEYRKQKLNKILK